MHDGGLLKKSILDFLDKNPINDFVNKEWYHFISSDRPAVIFGAGRQARIVIELCMMYQKKYFCLMTTSNKDRWGLLPRENELPLYLISEFPKELDKNCYDVIIAIDIKHANEIRNMILQNGFTNIYAIDWNQSNDALREAFYNNYLQFHGVKIINK